MQEHKPWLVQKYGGTSVAKLLDVMVESIIPESEQLHNVAVVCSARSSTTKSKGTTSMLVQAIHYATSNEVSPLKMIEIINEIQEEHLSAARLIYSKSAPVDTVALMEDLKAEIIFDCEQLRNLLTATWTVGEISERTQDRVLSVGEKLSCRIVVAALIHRGLNAELVDLNDIVSERYGENSRQLQRAYRQNPSDFLSGLTSVIESKLQGCNGKIPVVPGFFGMMPDSLIHGVGRGYSDLCAALCAVSICAEELQIWKEVDGIFTADPTKVKSARLLNTVTSEEAAELTYFGSEVIHPLTMEQIRKSCIPLRLKNVKNPNGSGTIIYPSASSSGSDSNGSPDLLPTVLSSNACPISRSIFMTANGYHGDSQYRRTPTAITVKEAITVINIGPDKRIKLQEFLGEVSERLTRHRLSIDLISSSQQMVSLAVSLDGPNNSTTITEAVSDLSQIGLVSVTNHMSIVSVVGHKMRNMVGIAGEIFSVLAGAKINIYLISQGASEINISFVVRAQDALLAMDVVHTTVMKIPAQSEQENSFIKGPWLY